MKKLIVLVVVILTVMSMTSCRTGYGCQGKSKNITGYKSRMGFGY